MFIEIVTPDKKVFEGEATSAIFPGTDGSFQILNNHAALVSTLGKGNIIFVKTINNKSEEVQMEVDGGVVEVLNNKVTVLAEKITE
ncbi:MAG: ATP synthase F1 subunit epsilon [Flammeovirgaceae bacterium TMED32]|jgi:F-type H+-transporting ATPase subunit epsilon|nr:MAG: ATP synthase F1 subunit epsilon [Flammeovirgaceae bacterium TMED32]|tara:strand:+ start:3892 stop:4149 length:258 start_codon:yes stop_codon:yes gene_type:complete